MSPAADPRQPQRAALRRAVMALVIGVIALDVLALAIYTLADIGQQSNPVRTAFVVGWTLATAVTVAVLLRRVRMVRRGR